MELLVPIQLLTIIAFIMNVAGLLLAIFFGPPYMIMSSSKRAYLSGVDPNDPYIRKAALRDLLAMAGISLFLLGIAIHIFANMATGPLHFNFVFRPNF